MHSSGRLATNAVIAFFSAAAVAAVSPEEAKQLGGSTLTLFGAEKAGNKDGSIPEYAGEPVKMPSCYNPNEPGTYCDPWSDKPLFTITAQNMAQYADKLTDGQKELFKKFPSYRMVIYPTRRTMVYPKYVLDNTIKNATVCQGKEGELLLEGCYGGIPFPIPKTGNQAVWNHVVKYSSFNTVGKSRTVFVGTNGGVINESESVVTANYPYYDPNNKKPLPSNAVYYRVRLDTFGPTRRNGEKIVVIQGIDPIHVGNRAWQYIPGQRRVKLAPDLAYDTPSPVSGGGSVMDEQNLFFGAQDRFDFKLVGKRETFIIYNSFATSDAQHCPEAIYGTKNFPNPDCTRWELHRTWHVHATLKPGYRNIMPVRDMYFDEDAPAAGTSEGYDAAGKVYHINNQIIFPFYDQGSGMVPDTFYTLDLQTGAWSFTSFSGYKGYGYHPAGETKPEVFWSPESMAGEGIR